MPSAIEKLYRDLKDQKFTVLAIDIQEDPARVEAWARSHGVTSPILLDKSGAVATAYRVTATPTTVLIGRDGRLIARAVGRRPWDEPAGRALLDAVLATR